MYFGTRERFDYVECASCGSLQIRSVPDDLARHYPDNYYSHLPIEPLPTAGWLRDWIRRERSSHLLGRRNLIGKLLERAGYGGYFSYPWEWFRRTNAFPESRILDVGCGRGDLLRALRSSGFRRLIGVDPFRRESEHFDGISLLKQSVFDVEGSFDLVMSHHSLEHTPDPLPVLSRLSSLAAPGGFVLLRIPIANESWRTYGTNWVELDPPRHLCVPTLNGIEELIRRVGGLEVTRVEFDADEFELAGSELYARDIPLFPPEQEGRSSVDLRFERDERVRFQSRMRAMNEQRTSGRAAFFLRVS